MVISSKKLFKLTRKWQDKAAPKRRVTWPKRAVAEKGHFVAYTIDGRRFMIPLSYLKSEVFKELFRMAEEEFGVPSDGPITLPCDSVFMEYAMFIVRNHAFVDLKDALLSLADFCCPSLGLYQGS
ncbi:auxin-responsive protein SAUR68-like [Chenopodium quinoa]|uniref:auxin-responsive protein SAUR68-like n=1 Tax=Chenopodium quinoa TaxID=63459 RepID=UPI000B777D14|nr:auxin-responsive protein SAUR68-like [Chenopodium quinoa]